MGFRWPSQDRQAHHEGALDSVLAVMHDGVANVDSRHEMFGQVMLDNSNNIDRKVRLPADPEIADLNGHGAEEAAVDSDQPGDLRESHDARTKLAKQTKPAPMVTGFDPELALQQVAAPT